MLSWFTVCKSDASQCIAVLSPSQSRSHGLWFATLMLHSALMFCLEAVDVFFNMKAWATPQTSIDWIKKTWHPYLAKLKDEFQKDGSQSCCHGLWFASLMLHSALLFCHPPNLARRLPKHRQKHSLARAPRRESCGAREPKEVLMMRGKLSMFVCWRLFEQESSREGPASHDLQL